LAGGLATRALSKGSADANDARSNGEIDANTIAEAEIARGPHPKPPSDRVGVNHFARRAFAPSEQTMGN
jgi:hypothetical protein